jgi:hypothetical protein
MHRNWKRTTATAGGLLVAILLLPPERAAGWGPGGHRVVANIAYDKLEPATRAKIVSVLRKHPDFDNRFGPKMPEDIRKGNAEDQDRWIFLQAAIWPDLVRPHPPYHKRSWHFINMPFYLSPLDQAALQDALKPNISFSLPSPLTKTAQDHLNCVQAWKLCMRGLTDAHATDGERAIDYCWLLHIAGDIHQPLHATALVTRGRFNTAEGDMGGNAIKIKQGHDLHSYWDGLLGGNQTLNDIRGRAADILADAKLRKAAESAAAKMAVEVWVVESNQLAKDFVYSKLILDEVAAREADASQPLQKVDLPQEYRQQAGQLARQRVAEAGYRLAEALKQITE